MADPPSPIAPPAPIRPPSPPMPPSPPIPPQAPSRAFATCTSDDAAMVRVPARHDDDPAYKKRGVRLPTAWFPAAPAPTTGNQVVSYTYGVCAFNDMAEALLTAFAPEHRIYIAGWGTNKDVVLKAGTTTTLEGYLSSTRAQVRGMFYDGVIGVSPWLSTKAPVENKWVTDAINAHPSGGAVLDGKLPPIGFHHQKLLVVQGQFGLVAFVGGMDIDPSRISVDPGAGRPMHDTHLRIAGNAALACRRIFEDRWLDHPATHQLDQKLGASATATTQERRALAFPAPAAFDPSGLPSCTYLPGSKRENRPLRVAVGRTFANLTKAGRTPYGFAPNGEYTAWSLIERGIQQAVRWIYLEDQYLISRMARAALLDKFKDPAFEFLLMVMNGSAAAAVDVNFLVTARNELRRDLAKIDPGRTRWGMYTLKDLGDPERQKWCGTYLHSKTWIFDDGYTIIGSANCDNRGYTHDAELMVGVADADAITVHLGEGFAADLRTRLWHKHLGLPHAQVRDFEKGLRHWRKPPPTAMIQDASALEIDTHLSPPAQFPSAAEAPNYEFAWTKFVDPDSR
ncbi:MAG TPA: phospholipase D-like domain-containing protein [Solirubrobacteraceae bacterium]